jgi:hypothetical protein
MNKNHDFYIIALLKIKCLYNICGYHSWKTLTRLHSSSREYLGGLKGLLHILNAIVFPTKAYLCFLFLLCFYFCFAKRLAKCKFGVFDECLKVLIWTPLNLYSLGP